jgi:hypothetical protein
MRLSLPQLKLVAVLAHVGHRVLQPIHTVHHVNTKPFQTLQKRPVAYFQSIDLTAKRLLAYFQSIDLTAKPLLAYFQSIDLTAKPLLAYFQPLQSRKNVILLIAHHSTLPAMLLRLYHHTPSSG